MENVMNKKIVIALLVIVIVFTIIFLGNKFRNKEEKFESAKEDEVKSTLSNIAPSIFWPEKSISLKSIAFALGLAATASTTSM